MPSQAANTKEVITRYEGALSSLESASEVYPWASCCCYWSISQSMLLLVKYFQGYLHWLWLRPVCSISAGCKSFDIYRIYILSHRQGRFRIHPCRLPHAYAVFRKSAYFQYAHNPHIVQFVQRRFSKSLIRSGGTLELTFHMSICVFFWIYAIFSRMQISAYALCEFFYVVSRGYAHINPQKTATV